MTAAPTTDLAVPSGRADLALPVVTGGTSSALALMTEFSGTVRQVEAFVNALVDTPFVPEAHWPLPVGVKAWEMPNKSARMRHARETPEDWKTRRQIACASGTGAVLTGLPLGLDPLVALSQVFVVKGRPGLYTKLKVALAQARGHEVWDVERSDTRVIVAGRRRGWPTDRSVEITVTIEDARRAKWTENEAYEKTPADMLWSRAASRVLDRIAADVLFGIASIEDLEVDGDPAEPATATRPATREPDPAAPASSRSSSQLRAALEDAGLVASAEQTVALDARDEAAVVEVVEEEAIDDGEWRRLNGRLHELGVVGRGQAADRLRVMGEIVGRPIEQGRQLSRREAGLILDTLAGESGEETVARILFGNLEPTVAEPEVPEQPGQPVEVPEQPEQPAQQPVEDTLVDPWGEP